GPAPSRSRAVPDHFAWSRCWKQPSMQPPATAWTPEPSGGPSSGPRTGRRIAAVVLGTVLLALLVSYAGLAPVLARFRILGWAGRAVRPARTTRRGRGLGRAPPGRRCRLHAAARPAAASGPGVDRVAVDATTHPPLRGRRAARGEGRGDRRTARGLLPHRAACVPASDALALRGLARRRARGEALHDAARGADLAPRRAHRRGPVAADTRRGARHPGRARGTGSGRRRPVQLPRHSRGGGRRALAAQARAR